MTTDGAGCILFLDFDGVTHPDPCDAGQHFTRLPLIEEVLRPYPACKIVISSSWRVVHPLDEMRNFFAIDMRSRVIGVTPEHGGPGGNGSWGVAVNHERQWECERWLLTGQLWLPRNRRAGAPWIAIDDREHWFRPGCANLLLTDASTGFGPDDGPRLVDMLRKRLS